MITGCHLGYRRRSDIAAVGKGRRPAGHAAPENLPTPEGLGKEIGIRPFGPRSGIYLVGVS